jgi:hypothetical protein
MQNLTIGPLVIIAALLTALFVTINTEADIAGSIVIECTGPATRVDGTPLPASELASYNYRRNGADIASTAGSVCGYVYTIPAGQCVRKAEVFSAQVVDTAGRASAWAVSRPITRDYCAPEPPPATSSAPAAPTIDRLVAPR